MSDGSAIYMPISLDAMVKPNIAISPFSYATLDILHNKACPDSEIRLTREWLSSYLERDYTLTHSGRHGLSLILSELGLSAGDVVTIFPSLGHFYVSGCVTKTIEKFCNWSMKIESATKAVLVIHEWGIPHTGIQEIRELGYPLIEDCAYAFASSYTKRRVGITGDYAVYSLPKFFPVNFGGIVCGLGKKHFIENAAENYLLKAVRLSGELEQIVSARTSNWLYLKHLFASIGEQPHFELSAGVVPGVFMFSVSGDIRPEIVKETYQHHGIESSVYYGAPSVYIPCHQNLGQGAMQYLFEIYNSLASSRVFNEKGASH